MSDMMEKNKKEYERIKNAIELMEEYKREYEKYKKIGNLLSEAKYIITMPDGTQWSVPILIIALNRAKYYQSHYEYDLGRSLLEDTIPLFVKNIKEVAEWAKNNMDWSDVNCFAKTESCKPPPVDYQEGWVNGEWKVRV